ncbi:unnamed protein product [Boreogadus saida]
MHKRKNTYVKNLCGELKGRLLGNPQPCGSRLTQKRKEEDNTCPAAGDGGGAPVKSHRRTTRALQQETEGEPRLKSDPGRTRVMQPETEGEPWS